MKTIDLLCIDTIILILGCICVVFSALALKKNKLMLVKVLIIMDYILFSISFIIIQFCL